MSTFRAPPYCPVTSLRDLLAAARLVAIAAEDTAEGHNLRDCMGDIRTVLDDALASIHAALEQDAQDSADVAEMEMDAEAEARRNGHTGWRGGDRRQTARAA